MKEIKLFRRNAGKYDRRAKTCKVSTEPIRRMF